MNTQRSSFSQEVLKIINARMSRFNISQSELAASIGLSQSQLSKILRGTRPMDVDVFAGICDSLDMAIGRVAREAELIVNDPFHGSERIPSAAYRLVDGAHKLTPPLSLENDNQTYFNHNNGVEYQKPEEWSLKFDFRRDWASNPRFINNNLSDRVDPYKDTDKDTTLSEEERKRLAIADLHIAANDNPDKEVERDYYPDSGA